MIAGTAGATRAGIPGPANLWRCRPARCRSSNRRDTSAGGWTEAAARPSRGSRRRSWASRSLPAHDRVAGRGRKRWLTPLKVRKPAYPLGPRFAGPRQGLAGGSAPSTPDRSALPAEVHGLSHGSRLDAATRDPTPPATDTMSPNPAAWCVRIAPRVGRGVVPLRYERADDGFGRGVQRRGKLGVRRGAPLPLPGRSVQHCVGWLLTLSLRLRWRDGSRKRTRRGVAGPRRVRVPSERYLYT